MSKKMEFVQRATEPGVKLAPLCTQFGISRQTGYKWLKRFREHGFEGLEEESRRPKSSPLSLAEDVVAAILDARDAHPSWGPRKLEQLLRRRFGPSTPSRATVARILKRFGRIRRRRARGPISLVDRAPCATAAAPNDVWTVDFKGWWRSHDGVRCEPLTVRDACTRFVLAATLTRTSVDQVRPVFEALFRKHGLPSAIQCDNGTPFINVRGRGGLSRLSAWWVSLGIRIVRSRPACPQDNGGHERMHRDMAREVEESPASNAIAQQRVLDRWRQEFNHVRPHDALDGKSPAELYRPSTRRYRGSIAPSYPPHFAVKRVVNNGTIYFNGDQYFVSLALAGQSVGLEQLSEFRWKVWLHELDCGELEMLPPWIDDHLAPRATAAIEVSRPAHRPRRRTNHPTHSPQSNRQSSVNEVSPKVSAMS